MNSLDELRVMNILLIEDDDDHAQLTLRSLHHQNSPSEMNIERLADGEAALQFLKREGQYADAFLPDIILLDLNLPKVGGLEVLSWIKKHSELCRIPVVILTTSDAETDRSVAYGNHANSYLVKPVELTQFRDMISEVKAYWGVWNRPASRLE